MKSIFLTTAALLLIIASYAQQPSPDPDTLKNPVKQIDPEVKQAPADIHYVDEMQRIAAAELPQPVLDSLKQHEPAAWEKSVVYRDKTSNTFTVEVREGGTERMYRFDATGKRLEDGPKQQDQEGN